MVFIGFLYGCFLSINAISTIPIMITIRISAIDTGRKYVSAIDDCGCCVGVGVEVGLAIVKLVSPLEE